MVATQSKERDPPVARHDDHRHVQRRLRQPEADHAGDRAGDDGRQHAVDRALSDRLDEKADGDVEEAGGEDADLHHRDDLVGRGHAELDLVPHRLRDAQIRRDVAEARAVEERDEGADRALGENERDDRRDAGAQENSARMKAAEQRHQHGGREHRDDVLRAEQHELAERRFIVWQIAGYHDCSPLLLPASIPGMPVRVCTTGTTVARSLHGR